MSKNDKFDLNYLPKIAINVVSIFVGMQLEIDFKKYFVFGLINKPFKIIIYEKKIRHMQKI